MLSALSWLVSRAFFFVFSGSKKDGYFSASPLLFACVLLACFALGPALGMLAMLGMLWVLAAHGDAGDAGDAGAWASSCVPCKQVLPFRRFVFKKDAQNLGVFFGCC